MMLFKCPLLVRVACGLLVVVCSVPVVAQRSTPFHSSIVVCTVAPDVERLKAKMVGDVTPKDVDYVDLSVLVSKHQLAYRTLRSKAQIREFLKAFGPMKINRRIPTEFCESVFFSLKGNTGSFGFYFLPEDLDHGYPPAVKELMTKVRKQMLKGKHK